ncbi:hypothetical protein BT67DRAFT_355668, partial [Trichocladium antarcticum]
PPPPLLLTKRVTSFLRANLSPHVHAAMLTTPAGSLLAHASNLPAHALRRQCAVAASLWALQGPTSSSNPAGAGQGTVPAGSKKKRSKPPVVTVQLDSGAVFVIRRLRCGMLFICIGGTEGSAGRRTPTPSEYRPLSPTSSASIHSAHTTGAATTTSMGSSTYTASGSVSGMRRQVEELARWLDERLGGLYVPEEGIGI